MRGTKLFLLMMVLIITPAVVYASQQTINLTITNTTVTLNSGTISTIYAINATNSSSYVFNFSVADCISTSANITLNVTTVGIDYDRIRLNTVCNLNQSCPQPTCPQPNCPATTCPSLDYTTILSAITSSSEATMQKIKEVNSSLSLQKSGSFSFPKLPNWAPYAAIIALIAAFVTREKWLPKVKQFSKQQKETTRRNGGEEEPK